ncbi:phage tail protein I [Zooshikella sp. RANM57]|uniref:phage tail protein I n=1 Tax=Zooshikella sp. RANM57 TaxID=3425863 RepID=UPI003D6DC83C
MNSLMPPNASSLERDLEFIANKSTDLPILIKTLWNPFNCPVQLLPWLAWAFSVDEWNDEWPEAVKRKVVQNSFDVHRFKATPYAVQKVLDGLNIKAFLREWWEPGGSQQPGTATVVALLNENVVDDDGLFTKSMLQQVFSVVESAKRGVIHLDVELGISFDEGFSFAACMGSEINCIDWTGLSDPLVPGNTKVGVSVGGVFGQLSVVDFGLNVVPVAPKIFCICTTIAAGAFQYSASDIEFEGVI